MSGTLSTETRAQAVEDHFQAGHGITAGGTWLTVPIGTKSRGISTLRAQRFEFKAGKQIIKPRT